MNLRIVLALVTACFSLGATAATKYYISADVVRGTAGAQGAACVANTVFFPGEQVVWRAIVFDSASHTQLSQEQAKALGVRVTVNSENAAPLNMRYGLHPPDPKAPKRDLFWSTNYPIALTASAGTLKWNLTATDSEGNTGTYSPIGQDAGLNLLTIAKPQAAAPKTGAAGGQGLYAQYCSSCHQASGQGIPGAFTPLANSSVVNGDATYLTHVVLSGLEGKLTVRGQSYDGNMPGMGAVLSDAQLASILTYIRSAWTNKASPVSEETVKAERAKAGNARENYARYPR